LLGYSNYYKLRQHVGVSVYFKENKSWTSNCKQDSSEVFEQISEKETITWLEQ